jgi:SAM-dependent methyltransferase
MNEISFDEGSFCDPEGHVFYYNNEIYRSLEPSAVERMTHLLSLPFFNDWVREGKIVDTIILESLNKLPTNLSVTKHILWHEKIPNISYPFEWTFSMLKDGALLTLDLMQTLLENNFILKDGTAWNICFSKGSPCFFDILSIDTYKEGQPWNGLSQFLQEFLYPLMLQAYEGTDFQPLWQATQQGIPVKFLYKILSKKFLFKKGVFKYVYLLQKLSEKKSIEEASLIHNFSPQTFPKKMLVKLLKDLQSCIESLEITKDSSVWKNYISQNSYESTDTKQKENFVEDGLKSLKPVTIIDLGCNTGQYSLIASKMAQVISCDLDPTCLNQLYLKKNKNILPVVLNLMNPSPSTGWKLKARKDVFTRFKADTFLALALMHHICISNNVPLKSFVDFLRSIASQGIIEWVDKSDPMVQFLLRNREDIFKDYTWENFETIVKDKFIIKNCIELNKGKRKILLLEEKK